MRDSGATLPTSRPQIFVTVVVLVCSSFSELLSWRHWEGSNRVDDASRSGDGHIQLTDTVLVLKFRPSSSNRPSA